MRLSRIIFIFIMVLCLTPAWAAPQKQKPMPSKKPAVTAAQTSPRATASQASSRAPAAAPGLAVENIRYGVNGGKTRIVIDLNGPSDYRTFTMGGPWRVVVDLPPVSWKTAKSAQPRGTPLLKQYRSGSLNDGITRIVFDLSKPAFISGVFMLPRDKTNKDRLVIDLQQATQSFFNEHEKKVIGNINLRNTFGGTVAAQDSSRPRIGKMAGLDGSLLDEMTESAMPSMQTAPMTAPAAALAAAPAGGIVMPSPKPSAVSAPAVSSTTPAPQPRKQKFTVVIDAGHGGEDPGALGDGGIREKNITLSVARQLKDQLLATGRYNVVMTRDRDVYIKLHRRVDISREKGGDVFISIHADKTDRNAVRGASIYTLSDKASDAETARLADDANNSGVVAGVDLSVESHDVAGILLDLAMREKMNESNLLAQFLENAFRRENVRLLPNSHRSAGFAVLKAPDVPSVLIETGFLSNAEEAKLLNSPQFQSQIASAIRAGIDAYFTKMQALQRY